MTPDPHATKYSSLTPYHYCANNPLLFIDPDGKDIIEHDNLMGSDLYLRAKEILLSDPIAKKLWGDIHGDHDILVGLIGSKKMAYDAGGRTKWEKSDLGVESNTFNWGHNLPIIRLSWGNKFKKHIRVRLNLGLILSPDNHTLIPMTPEELALVLYHELWAHIDFAKKEWGLFGVDSDDADQEFRSHQELGDYKMWRVPDKDKPMWNFGVRVFGKKYWDQYPEQNK